MTVGACSRIALSSGSHRSPALGAAAGGVVPVGGSPARGARCSSSRGWGGGGGEARARCRGSFWALGAADVDEVEAVVESMPERGAARVVLSARQISLGNGGGAMESQGGGAVGRQEREVQRATGLGGSPQSRGREIWIEVSRGRVVQLGRRKGSVLDSGSAEEVM